MKSITSVSSKIWSHFRALPSPAIYLAAALAAIAIGVGAAAITRQPDQTVASSPQGSPTGRSTGFTAVSAQQANETSEQQASQSAAKTTTTTKTVTTTGQTTTGSSPVTSTTGPTASTPPTPTSSPTFPSNPTTQPANNPSASFTAVLDQAHGYKDKARNTLVAPIIVTHEPGHTAAVTLSTTSYAAGATCAINNGNAEMTFEDTLPAGFYGCKITATDGTTTQTFDFMIHHSGGPTNS